MKSYRLTYNEIRNYFLKQPKGSVVGRSGLSCSCPLVSVYEDKLNRAGVYYSEIGVNDKDTTIFDKNYSYKTVMLPKFAARFVAALDKFYPTGSDITREQALFVLEASYGIRNIKVGSTQLLVNYSG